MKSLRKRVEKAKQSDPDIYRKAGRKGNAARKNPRQYFKELAEKDPEQLKKIGVKGAASRWERGEDGN